MINSAFARDTGGEQNLIEHAAAELRHPDQPLRAGQLRQLPPGRRLHRGRAGVDAHRGARPRLGLLQRPARLREPDGEQGLAFVRSRKMEILDRRRGGGSATRCPIENRVQRQQIFIQRAMTDALAEVKSNPLRLRELVDIGVSNVSLDPNLGIGDILDLADHFKGFDASKLEAYALPLVRVPGRREPAAARRGRRRADAQRVPRPGPGRDPAGARDGQGAERHRWPTRRSGARASPPTSAARLQQVGFQMAAPDDADTFYPQTTIEYAPGQQAYAQRLARHITSATAIPMAENPDLAAGTRAVDRRARLHDASTRTPTPIEAMPAAPGAAPAEPAAGGEGPRRGAGCPADDDADAPRTRSSSAPRPRAPTADRRRPRPRRRVVGSGAGRWQDAGRRSRRGVTMDDAEVIGRIGALVDEEHALERAQADRRPRRVPPRTGSGRSRWRSTSAGTCSASAAPAARWARTPTRPRCARPRSSSATSSRGRGCTGAPVRLLELPGPAPFRRVVRPERRAHRARGRRPHVHPPARAGPRTAGSRRSRRAWRCDEADGIYVLSRTGPREVLALRVRAPASREPLPRY